MKQNQITTLIICICISILLTSCAEEQLIVSPEPDIENMLSVNSVHKFTPLEIYPENSDVFYEGSKIIVRPRQKITIKEFLESYPYEIRLDSTIKENIEISILTKTSPNSTIEAAPCNTRAYSYQSRDRYKPYHGKTISNFLGNDPNSPQTSITMRDNYGFSQVYVRYNQFSDFTSVGWDPSQIIVLLQTDYKHDNYKYYYESIVAIDSLKNGVWGFSIDEPLDWKERQCDLDFIAGAKIYVQQMAALANPKPLLVSSFRSGTGAELISCSSLWPLRLDVRYKDFTPDYNDIMNSSGNAYIMCDKYEESSSALKSRWSAFKNNWSNRNPGIFMHLDHQYSRSYATFSDLFSHARNLGLNEICLYSDYPPLGQGQPLQRLNSFCSVAFNNYYLRGFAQHVTIYERCGLPNCVGCENSDNWYVYEIAYSGVWYEVYP